VAYISNLKVAAIRALTAAVALRGGVGSGTLSGNVTLTNADSYVLAFTASGASRNVTLPPGEDGRGWVIANAGSAYNIVVKNSAGTTLVTLYPRQAAVIVCEGTTASVLIGPRSSLVADPGNAGAIPVTASGYCPIVTAGSETRTLAAPQFPGQTLDLYIDTDGGTCVITASLAINQTGNNTITMADVGDFIRLVGVTRAGVLRWQVAANDGAALTTV